MACDCHVGGLFLVMEWDGNGSAGCVQFSRVAAVQGKAFERVLCLVHIRVHTRSPVLEYFRTACRPASLRAD